MAINEKWPNKISNWEECLYYADKEKEQAVIRVIAQHPGIKLAELSQKTAIAMRTLRRILHRATEDSILAKIEYRGSKKIGGWFPKV